MEEFTSLIALDANTSIKMQKLDAPLPSKYKKAADEVYAPQVKQGFVRLFPSFYELNHQNEVDPKNPKIRIKEKESFTRYLQLPGQDKTAIFTTREVYFIPLHFKFGRLLYEGKYEEGVKRAPDCQSTNGIVPVHNKIANTCGECPKSKWVDKIPPPCGEIPEILALDMTASTIKDEAMKAAVTKEAFTISFSKTAIKGIKALMKELAEPVAFDDGTYGQVDMTQYIVKMTAPVHVKDDGKEATYCVPRFEIIGKIPPEVSDQLLKMLNSPAPNQNGKTVLEAFIGPTEPAVGGSENDSNTETSEDTKPASEQTIDVKAEKPAAAKSTPPKAKAAEVKEAQEPSDPEDTGEVAESEVAEDGDGEEIYF